MKAFISYSHKDSEYLVQLKIHLAQLRRSDLLQDWTDHEIKAGTDIDPEVISQLESSDLFLALVSSDYLDSGYCYEKELTRALQLKKAGELKIVPVICRPCEWKETPFKNMLAIPKDGKPISEWASRDSAFFDITSQLRTLVSKNSMPPNNSITIPTSPTKPMNSRYKVSKDFDKIQKIEFLDESFNEIVRTLKEYLEEISLLENVKYKTLRESENIFKCVLVNRDKGIAQAEMTLTKCEDIDHRVTFSYMNGDITGIIQSKNSEAKLPFTLTADEYTQFFEKRDFMGSNDRKTYSAVEIADELWQEWLKYIGITMD